MTSIVSRRLCALLGSTALICLPAAAADATWLGTSTTWEDLQNWSTGVAPGSTDDVKLDGATDQSWVNAYDPATVNSITSIVSDSPFRVDIWDAFTVTNGITNLNTGDNVLAFGVFGHLTLGGGTIEGPVEFYLEEHSYEGAVGVAFQNDADAGDAYFWVSDSTGVTFEDQSSAGTADIRNYGSVSFTGTSTAGDAEIHSDQGAVLIFEGESTGGTAYIENLSGASMNFYDDTDAGSAEIVNNGVGASINFFDNASAGSATITNRTGFVIFSGTSTAGEADIANVAGGGFGTLIFDDESTAGDATLSTVTGHSINFYGTSTAGSSEIAADGGTIVFQEQSKAGSATITANGGEIRFREDSDAQGATLVVNDGGTVSFAHGATGGTARIVLSSGGTLSIGALATGYLSTGSIEGAGAVVLGSNNLLVGNNNLSTTFSGVISGEGAFEKTGTGTLTLTGTNTYSGETTVSGGKLVVNGSIASSAGLIVGPDGSLGGTGELPGIVVLGGTFAPGNSIGTITVNGDLDFTDGSTYQVEVNAAGDSDLTVVTGTATLDGVVEIIAGSGDYADTTTYTILEAAAISGSFDDVTSNLAFLSPTLSEDATHVYLTLTRNAVDFASAATTPNQVAAAGAAQELGDGNAIYDAIVGMTAEDAADTFDVLSGEAYASVAGVLLHDSRLVRRAALDRVLDGDGDGIWGEFYGDFGTVAADGNAAATDHTAGGIIAGIDADWGAVRGGLFVDAGTTRVAVADRASTATSTDYGLGAYGGAELGPWQLAVGGAVTRHSVAMEREVDVPGFRDMLQAAYDTMTAQAFGELGYRVALDPVTLTPFVSLAQVRQIGGQYAEEGGEAAIAGSTTAMDATFATLGLRAQASLGDVLLSGLAGWQHASSDVPSATHAFAGGAPFTVTGASPKGDSLVIEAGIEMPLEGATFDLSYGGSAGEGGQSHALSAQLSGSF